MNFRQTPSENDVFQRENSLFSCESEGFLEENGYFFLWKLVCF